jgi:hypothetical protein
MPFSVANDWGVTNRKRGKGKERSNKKKRAGARKHRLKKDRLGLKNIRVGYWNCKSAKQRGPVLDRLIYDFDIFLIQELNATAYMCPGYKCYVDAPGDGRHGQA